MKTAERAALDFALAHIERHGDSPASEKAKQHRLLVAQEAAAVEPAPDATGHPGEVIHEEVLGLSNGLQIQTSPFPAAQWESASVAGRPGLEGE